MEGKMTLTQNLVILLIALVGLNILTILYSRQHILGIETKLLKEQKKGLVEQIIQADRTLRCFDTLQWVGM